MDMIHARACEVRCTEGEKSQGQNVGWEGMGKEEGRESGRAGLGEGVRGDDVCDVSQKPREQRPWENPEQ